MAFQWHLPGNAPLANQFNQAWRQPANIPRVHAVFPNQQVQDLQNDVRVLANQVQVVLNALNMNNQNVQRGIVPVRAGPRLMMRHDDVHLAREEKRRSTSLYFSLPTKVGSPKYVVDNGFVYVFSDWNNRVEAPVGYYRCFNKKCQMRIHLMADGEIVYAQTNTDHVSPECLEENFKRKARDKHEMEKIREYVKNRTQDVNATPDKVLTELLEMNRRLRERGERTVSVTKGQIQSWMTRERSPYSGENAKILRMQTTDRWTVPPQRWLRFHSLVPRMSFFMLPENESELRMCGTWLIDGTFRAAPATYSQLINIVGVNTVQVVTYVPCVHILMKGKKEENYEEMLLTLLTCVFKGQKQVRKVVIDFEIAMKHALETVFRMLGMNVTVKGCLFHFSQAIYRWFRSNLDHDCKILRRLVYLTFWFPYLEQDEILDFIQGIYGLHEEVDEFLRYFKKQWMPVFSWWHVDDEDDVNTNCAIESFHGKLNGKIPDNPRLDQTSDRLMEMDHNVYLKQYNKRVNGIQKKRATKWKMFQEKQDLVRERMKEFIQGMRRLVPERQPLPVPIFHQVDEPDERTDGSDAERYPIFDEGFTTALEDEANMEAWERRFFDEERDEQ